MIAGEKKRWLIRVGMMLCAIALLLVGVLQNEQTQMMDKAIRICLECIGVG